MKKALLSFHSRLIINTLVYVSSCILFAWLISANSGTPISEFLRQLLFQTTNHLYRENANIILAPTILDLNLFKYIYLSYFLSITILILIAKIFIKNQTQFMMFIRSALLELIIIVYLTVLVGGMASLRISVRKNMPIASGRSAEEIYETLLPGIYPLCEYTRALLPGYHRALFISDLDRSADPGALAFRQLAYFLYPIDVRDVKRDIPYDVALVFYKKDAAAYVPEGFKIYKTINQNNIIAINANFE